MTLFKPVTSKVKTEILEIELETGHIVKFKITPKVFIDLERDENGLPFIWADFKENYVGVEASPNAIPLHIIKEKYKLSNLLTSELEYEHIQVGFIYDEGSPDNHKWMLNFMDVDNQFKFNFVGESVEINCPFTTTSWQDGIWHGRFVIDKKDVRELVEPVSGRFILNGNNDIGQHNTTPLDKSIDTLSLRYNVYSNIWTCDLKSKGKIIGEYPCKAIISDAPFVGKVDRSFPKPKVTADIDISNVEGVSMALNALIIKRK